MKSCLKPNPPIHPLTFHEALKHLVRVDPKEVCGPPDLSPENVENEQGPQNATSKSDPTEVRVAVPITRAVVDIPDSILQEYRRSSEQTHRDNKGNTRIAGWAVKVAAIYTSIAAIQSCLSCQANRLTRDQFQAVQRPYVSIGSRRARSVTWSHLKVECLVSESSSLIADQ